jgi:uncharacterized integral membrane protein
MIIFLIVGIILGGISVVFVLQNTTAITVTFFVWHITASLALVLISSIVAGIIITLLLLLPESIGNHFKFKNLEKENKKLTDELRRQKENVVFADDIDTAHAAVITTEKNI